MFSLLKSFLFEQASEDETIWHKRLRAPFFALTIEGKPILRGQVWRRKRNGQWEYQQDRETDDEYQSRV